MRLYRYYRIFISQALLCLGVGAAASELQTNTLYQSHFLLDPTSTNVCDLVVYKDLDGNVVPPSSVSSQIISRVERCCLIRIPGTEIRDVPATNYLPTVADMPNLPPPTGSFGLGTLYSESTNSSPSLPWVQVLPVQDVIIEASNLTNIAYLELVDRLAQFLELRTGVMPSGTLIFGTDGNWVTNYVPSYTIELSVRYSEP